MEISGKIKLLKNNQVDANGVAIAPLANELEYGQVAINYSALNPCLFFKDTNGKVVKIVTEEVIADTLADILGGSAADLSTLKELLDAFAASDVATTQANILERLSAAESGKVDKVAGKGLSTNDFTTAEKNKLAGIGAGANVTSVAGKTGEVELVKDDVGLSNVVNKEQLGKTETAADSNKLGGLNPEYVRNFNTKNTDVSPTTGGYDANKLLVTGGCMSNYGSALYWANTPSPFSYGSIYQLPLPSQELTTQFAFDVVHNSETPTKSFWFRTAADAGFKNDWREVYHSGNANKADVDWTARHIDANGNGKFSGDVTAKGDVVAYSSTSNVYVEPTAGGVGNLFELGDVELPTTLTNNYVLAYDAGKKKWTAKESAGTGGSYVDYNKLSNVPDAFTPCAHNHEDATYVSDVRLKQNINPLSNALNTVLSLDAKSFGWTTEAKNRYNMNDEISYGYIAQDVQKIIPDIVKELETGDGYIGVEYIKVIPFVTEAIKQLHNNTVESNLNLKKELNKMNKVYSSLSNDYKKLQSELSELKAKLK